MPKGGLGETLQVYVASEILSQFRTLQKDFILILVNSKVADFNKLAYNTHSHQLWSFFHKLFWNFSCTIYYILVYTYQCS